MLSRTSPPTPGIGALVTGLCWVIVVFDGYDLIVYGTVLPRLLTEPGWGQTVAGAGLLGSLAFAGMLVGAVLAGTMSDRLGRRRMVIACSAWFSMFTALCAVAPGPVAFGGLRLLAGLGLGGLVPCAGALAAEFVSPRHRSMVATLMMSGIAIGGCLAALVGIEALPRWGWRAMFVIASLAVCVVVPAVVRLLPESPHWSLARRRTERPPATEDRHGSDTANTAPGPTVQPLRALLRAPYRKTTVLFCLATVMTLFAWYGLTTWLPQLMRDNGFGLGPALTFLLALSLGAVLGSLITAWAGIRFGPLPAGVVAALAAAAGLLLLMTHPGTTLTYAALMLAGIGTHGTQCLVLAAVANHYPAHLRGSALGFCLGFGRVGAVLAPLTGGWLLAADIGIDANFLAFAAATAAAAMLLTNCPRVPSHTEEVLPA
jgi:MFS transporter, AAHS family, benzoate transport protein